MEAPDGQVSFRSQGAKALPAQVLHDSSVPARAYLRRGSLVEELHSWGRVSYPCRTGGKPITPAKETVGTGTLLRWQGPAATIRELVK